MVLNRDKIRPGERKSPGGGLTYDYACAIMLGRCSREGEGNDLSEGRA